MIQICENTKKYATFNFILDWKFGRSKIFKLLNIRQGQFNHRSSSIQIKIMIIQLKHERKLQETSVVSEWHTLIIEKLLKITFLPTNFELTKFSATNERSCSNFSNFVFMNVVILVRLQLSVQIPKSMGVAIRTKKSTLRQWQFNDLSMTRNYEKKKLSYLKRHYFTHKKREDILDLTHFLVTCCL